MKPIDLLKLAEQADREGRYAIADKLTIRATRIAGPPVAEILQAGERGALHGLERAVPEAEMAAAEALLGRAAPGHRANTGNINSQVSTQGGIHGSPINANETVTQELGTVVKQTNKGPRVSVEREGDFILLQDGKKYYTRGKTREQMDAIKPQMNPDQAAKFERIYSRKGGDASSYSFNKNKQKTEIEAAQTGGTGAADTMKMEAPVSTSTGGVQQSGSPFNAGPNSRVFNVSEGSTMNMGVSNAALLGVTGIVAALGAIGMYLGRDGIVRDRNNVVVAPQNIPADVAKRLPRYQTMTRREEAGQLGGQRALDAQNFVDANASNPRVKNQRDWYNLALQTSGGDKNFANNVIAYVKASPEMPSQIGGGPNI